MAKPRVFVSSTYYDLKHIRASIESFIELLGYEPVLFESGDIPFQHDSPLDHSCYAEVEACHMLVLIIGGRYGSSTSEITKNSNDDEGIKLYNSVTKKEYETARAQKIPIFIFVEKGVYAEFRTYKENKTNQTIKYAHVDHPGIFLLLEDILSQTTNNFVKDFEHSDDIQTWLRDQWAGLFADFLKKQSVEKTLLHLSGNIDELKQVASTLKQYSESLMKNANVPNVDKVISEEGTKLKNLKALQIGKEALIRYLMKHGEYKGKLSSVYDALKTSETVPEFAEKLNLKTDSLSKPMIDLKDEAKRDYDEIRRKYFEADTELQGE